MIITLHEFMDDDALVWLRRAYPELESEMVNEAQACPVYDGKEVIIMREFFCHNPVAYFVMSYVHGNLNEKDNGWVLRVFGGVKENSDDHIAILRGFEVLSNDKLYINNG